MARGDLFWVELPWSPGGREQSGRRPVLVVQANPFNRSRIATVLAVVITTNDRLADLPGNVLLTQRESGLKQRSVANVSQIITADRTFLRERIGRIRPETMLRVESGLKLVLGLQ